MSDTHPHRPPHPALGAAFFAAIIVLFSIGAFYDLHGHRGVWPWFGVTVAAGIAAGVVVVVRGKPAEDTSMRGAWQRTRPWVGWMTGASLLLIVAGPVVGGLGTGFAIGMAVPMLFRMLALWTQGSFHGSR